MKFAVIATSGTQYRVEEGQTIFVDRVDSKEGASLTFDPMLVVQDSTIQVGTPTVSGSKVSAKVLGHERGKKLRVATYKSKSRNRRVVGFRPDLTKLEITKIA